MTLGLVRALSGGVVTGPGTSLLNVRVGTSQADGVQIERTLRLMKVPALAAGDEQRRVFRHRNGRCHLPWTR